MLFLQLRVVVWKNLIIRRRHWILTLIESLLPIILFLLIAYVRSKLPGLKTEEITKVEYNYPQVIHYNDLDVSSTRLYFTPNTELYQDLMRRVQVKFQMYNNNVKGFPTSESLLRYYSSHHNDTVIAIIFNEKDGKKLDYVLRIHQDLYANDINTGEMYKNPLQFETGLGSSYIHKGYLSIQKAIDISFIERISGKELENNVTVMMQEFPYPPHKQDSAIVSIFLIYLPVITLFSFIFISPAVLKRVVEEKYTGIRELLKMVGMRSWMMWLGWFIYGMIPMVFSTFCIVLLMKIPFFGTKYPPIEHTDGTVLFAFLILYCMAATVFCFAISCLFKKPTVAMVAGILIWILTYFVPKYGLNLEEMNTKLSWTSSLLLNLFPNMALHYGYVALSDYEQRDLGVQWNNFYKSSSGGTDDVTMCNVFLMLIIDMVVYMAFTLYMDGIHPGKYGVRKPVLFPIYYLVNLLKRRGSVEDRHGEEPLDPARIEEGKGLEKGIEIRGVVKRYGKKLAVNNLFLDIYQNQITVLLGHNGAGKSTTMSMITGMLDMSSGSIKINGKDIRTNMDDVRKSLGLCPQHNLLFTDLTVGEHLLFFAKLKGKTDKEAEKEMLELLEKLNMSDKRNAMAWTLSGGMRRKLCLGMAIIGGSEVLILDEPTSGMDPESRRELWDLLLAWRRKKTILITTHFMEEADALGDWIAIMGNGQLKCVGTPMKLKKMYDTGYHLSLIVRDDATAQDRIVIENNVKKSIPNAELKDCNGNNMVFLLPLEDNSSIATLLTHLENRKDDLKILNISVTVTTLEDVFLKVKMDSDIDQHKVSSLDSQDMVKATSDQQKLFRLRIKALFFKKCQFYRKKVWTYIVPTLIALLFFVLTVYLSGNLVGNSGDNGPQLKLQLSTYKHTTAFYNGTKGDEFVDKLKDVYRATVEANGGRAVDAEDVQEEIVNEGIQNIIYYKEHIIASAEFRRLNEIQAVGLYNGIATHSAPISLNLITNSLAKALLGDEYSISVRNWPLETVNSITTKEFSQNKVKLLWSVIMPIGWLLVVASFIVFPHVELSTNFAQLQYMCGVKPYWYWSVNYIMDLSVFVGVSAVLIAVAPIAAPYFAGREYLVLLLIFLLYGAANIPFAYLFSRKKSLSAGFAVFVVTGIFFGIVLTMVAEGLMNVDDSYYEDLGYALKTVFVLVLPQVGLAHSVMILSGKAVQNYNWEVMPKTKKDSMCSYEPNPCCFDKGETPQCEAFRSYISPLQENLLLMLGSCLIYLLVNLALDSYRIKKCTSKVKYHLSRWWSRSGNVNDYKIINDKSVSPKYNSLKAKNLNKMYAGRQIVRNIGFTLKEKECLGILGVNGAGKTTTFKMLTREEVANAGDIEMIGNNETFSIDKDEYLENLGYCPQNDALNFVLTGRQILSVIAQLRGIDDPEIVDKFLQLFELEEYADIACGNYSGGNKRKLSLAVALIGYPKFVLLDEPTNGVDPSSRRKFWTLIRNFKEKKDLSFILTSHSMVECEALCNNLKIMKDGRFEKEGTISDLKKEHGGFNVKLKLINRDVTKDSTKERVSVSSMEGYDEVDGGPMSNDTFNDIEQLKKYFVEKYKGTVKDEHCGLVHFYVEDKGKQWSTMFREMENLKSKNEHLIEDYAISEASLEDIFLTVARSEKDEIKSKKQRKVKGGTQTV